MKKAIIVISVIVISFIAGWTLMAPSLDYFDKYHLGVLLKKGNGTIKNGSWATRLDLAQSKTPPLIRAYIARIGIAANQAIEAIYWNAYTDNMGHMLDGTHSYDIHFKGRPPVRADGFWSLTVYDKNSYLVPNNEKRYSVGDRSPVIKDKDGSFIIKISSNKPMNSYNWLPCPSSGNFSLTLRMYLPLEDALKQTKSISMPEIVCLDCL